MEQRDFYLREIEKIDLLLTSIRQLLFGGRKENLAITVDAQINKTKDILLKKADFDLDLFLSLEPDKIEEYLTKRQGFDANNT